MARQRTFWIKRLWVDDVLFKVSTATLFVDQGRRAQGADDLLSWQVIAIFDPAHLVPENSPSQLWIEAEDGRTFTGEAIVTLHDGQVCMLTGTGELAGFDASTDFD
jgi:hypothetical protein